MENSLSLAAIEAEPKPKVVETFDKIADGCKRLCRWRTRIFQKKWRNYLRLLPRAGALLQASRGTTSSR